MSDDDDATRRLAATTAALLDQGRIVDGLSRPLTAAALIGLMLAPVLAGRSPAPTMFLLGLVALCGIVEAWFAMRVRFDAALLHRLAEAADPPDLAALDTALLRLGLLPPAKGGRPLAERAQGARRLLFRQAAALIAQVALILAAGVLAAAR